jgi:adenosine deaminase
MGALGARDSPLSTATSGATLNSDDPSMFSSPLAGEYELARKTFHLSDENLADIAVTAFVLPLPTTRRR